MSNYKLATSDGFCTEYAHKCGYLDTAIANDDPQFITMGHEGCVYFVKARCMPLVWECFDDDAQGRKDAHQYFMMLIKQLGAKRVIPKK